MDDDSLEQQRLNLLATFQGKIADKLKDAIQGRKDIGIEDRWKEDEEMFAGIDDANRGSKMLKPATSSGRVTIEKAATDGRSTIFINITAPYVKMGKSRAAEMLLPSEDKPFSINPTPTPEIIELQNSDEQMPAGNHTVGQAASAFVAEAEKKAQKAEDQIWTWLGESRWHTEMRKIIGQCAKLGTGVIKGPFPERKKYTKVNKQHDVITLVSEEKIVPASKWVDAWNFYPDPSCGSNIHNGGFVFERELLTAKRLRELKGTPGVIDSVIDEVLKEGPDSARKANDPRDNNRKLEKETFEIFYYYGEAKPDEYKSARQIDVTFEEEVLNVIVIMVNGKIIKASINPLKSGEFPYDVITWEAIEDFWAGQGVARQVNESQRICNGAARNMMDNAGLSAGCQIIIDRSAIEPADRHWKITPNKIWYTVDDANVEDIRKAITSIVIPSAQAELENIIKMALDLADRSTNMPVIMQGQQGGSTDTVGGMQILQQNSGAVLRDIARVFDDSLVKPHITRYYEWLMLFSDDESIKGDFEILPQGSTSFYERDAQNMFIEKLENIAQDPAYGLNKKKILEEQLKANKISPARVMYSDVEMEQQEKARQQNPPTDKAVQVAQIRAQVEEKKLQLTQQNDQQEASTKQQEFQSEAALKLQLAKEEHNSCMELAQINKEIRMMELAQAQGVSLDSIKSQLAQTTMKLQTQKELSTQALQVDAGKHSNELAHSRATQIIDHNHEKDMQALTPPIEPVGKASDGQSFAE